MKFCTREEAYGFYNKYAGLVGFSVPRANQTKSNQGVSSIIFVCFKERFEK